MPLDEWQEQALEAAMGERADGRWASKFVGVSAPRQNGKSQLIVARALAGILLFGEKTIIISAHEVDTAREVWKRMIDVVEANPNIERRVTGRMDAINREFLAFGHGLEKQTIKIKARRKSGTRGFSADCLLLDEAQILGKSAWGSIVPTMSAMPNPQMWLFGTPPTTDDDPFAFSRVRESAVAGKARHCWLEWSASPGDDLDSPETWAKANPAYGVRISYEACADDRAAMDDDQFRMERLGMWADLTATAEVAVDPDSWVRDAQIPVYEVDPSWRLAAVGLDMDLHGRLYASPASHHGEASVHVELMPDDLLAAGVDAAVDRLWKACRKRLPVVMAGDSGAAILEAPLRAKGMKVYRLNVNEQAQSSAGMVQALKDETITHVPDPLLEQAIRESAKEAMTGGRWRFKRTGELAGAPLIAAAAARHGAVSWSRRVNTDRQNTGRSSGGRSAGGRAASRR